MSRTSLFLINLVYNKKLFCLRKKEFFLKKEAIVILGGGSAKGLAHIGALEIIEKHGSIHFGDLKKKSNINVGNLSKLLNILLDYNLITKTAVPTDTKIVKTYYSLTDIGKNAMRVFKLIDELDRKFENSSPNSISIGTNHGNISIGNNNIVGDNINIKK